ncbi:MAG: hypothetical protein ACU836_02320 [Gammaproteobacteria bacterium]
MKYSLIAVLLIVVNPVFADETAKDEWNGTALSEGAITTIQQAQYNYKKCVADTMQSPDFYKLDVREATDSIIKQCEPRLAEMRSIYVDAGVPGQVADRHLRTLRIKVTRNLLQELMYREAAKQSGQIQ